MIRPRVTVDGVDASVLKEDFLAGLPTIKDGLRFQWGRNTIVDQPVAGDASFTLRQRHTSPTGDPYDQPSIFDTLHAGATVQVFAVDDDTGQEARCWVGEIARADVQVTDPYAVEATVTCVDPSALLSNLTIGDEPWEQQSAYDRFQAILEAARAAAAEFELGTAVWSWNLRGDMDESLWQVRVARRDVDAQPPLTLLQDLARSVGGVVWVTADEDGPFVWIEDPTARPGLRQFYIDDGDGLIKVRDAGLDMDGINLWPAEDVLRDPLTWTQDPTQAVTSVDVKWQEPRTDQEGNPTSVDHTRTFNDRYSAGRYGIRKMSIDTHLVDDPAAGFLAFQWIAVMRTGDWITTGLSIDTALLRRSVEGWTDEARIAEVMSLLDVRDRIGRQLTVDGLPAWAPTGEAQSLYVEGGTYTWEGGRWRLELTASANAIGGSATVEQFPPETTLADFDPTLTWIEAFGAGPLRVPDGFGGGPFGATPFGM